MPAKVLCGTPKEYCIGDIKPANQSLGKTCRCHQTHQEAFKCYAQYLIKIGYKQIANNEFQKDNDPILILTKKCRFGAQMRRGKGIDKGQGADRYVPQNGHYSKSGTIIG